MCFIQHLAITNNAEILQQELLRN